VDDRRAEFRQRGRARGRENITKALYARASFAVGFFIATLIAGAITRVSSTGGFPLIGGH